MFIPPQQFRDQFVTTRYQFSTIAEVRQQYIIAGQTSVNKCTRCYPFVLNRTYESERRRLPSATPRSIRQNILKRCSLTTLAAKSCRAHQKTAGQSVILTKSAKSKTVNGYNLGTVIQAASAFRLAFAAIADAGCLRLHRTAFRDACKHAFSHYVCVLPVEN